MDAQTYIANQISQIRLQGRNKNYENVKHIVAQTRHDWVQFEGDEYHTKMDGKVQAMFDQALALAESEA